MNVFSLIQLKSMFSLRKCISKTFPERIITGQVVFWGALPIILFLFLFAISVFSLFAFSLPFLALFGIITCLYWKTFGLCLSYITLGIFLLFHYNSIQADEQLWQMGILFALAINFFIFVLALEEIGSLIQQKIEAKDIKLKELTQSLLDFQNVSKDQEQVQKHLEEEIHFLKEEAEHRRLEKKEEEKKIAFIESEITLFNSQKDFLIAEAQRAQKILHQEDQETVKEIQERLDRASDDLQKSLASREALTIEMTKLKTQLEEGAVYEQENKALKEQILSLIEESKQCQKEREDDSLLMEKKCDLFKNEPYEKSILENEVEILKEALLVMQGKVMILQASPVIKTDQNKVKHFEGLYKQLRNQFEEKTQILSETRKELFRKEGKLLAMEREKDLNELSFTSQDFLSLEKDFNVMVEELISLETEVTELEELSTYLLN